MGTLGNFAKTNRPETLSAEKIQTWLIDQISRHTGISSANIDIAESFAAYGLNSVAAAGLSGELTHWLGERLPPTITWDYPSVKLLVEYLVSRFTEPCPLAS